MKHILFLKTATITVFIFIGVFSTSEAATIKLYPVDDSSAEMSDLDQFTQWNLARNYSGLIAKAPYTELPDTPGVLAVRSDKGSGFYRIYRVSTTFDLNALPNNVEISSVRLKLYKSIANNAGDAQVVVTSHNRQDVNLYQKQDWSISNFGTTQFAKELLQTNEYTSFEFNDAGVNYFLQPNGLITLGLLTSYDYENLIPTGFIQAAGWYSIEKPGTEFDPYLEITYEVPGESEFPALYAN